MIRNKLKNIALIALSFLMVTSFSLGIATFESPNIAHADSATFTFAGSSGTNNGGKVKKIKSNNAYYGRGDGSPAVDTNMIKSAGKTVVVFQITTASRVSEFKMYNSQDSAQAANFAIFPVSATYYNLFVATASDTNNQLAALVKNDNVTYKEFVDAGADSNTKLCTSSYVKTGSAVVAFSGTLTAGSGEKIVTLTTNNVLTPGYYGLFVETANDKAGWKSMTLVNDSSGGGDSSSSSPETSTSSSPETSSSETPSSSAVAEYTVTYNANGSTGGSVPTDSTKYTSASNTVTVLGNTGSLVKTGHTFAGWNTQANGNGTNYSADDTFTISSNTTLYAKWTANDYEINWNLDGGSVISGSTPSTAKYGATVALPTVEKDGKQFAGWSITDAASYTSSNFVMGASAVTVTAGWSDPPEPSKYTITFNANGGQFTAGGATHTVQIAEGSHITDTQLAEVKSALVNSADFGGWFTKNGSSWGGSDYEGGLSGYGYLANFDEISANTTVYALWVGELSLADKADYQNWIDTVINQALNNKNTSNYKTAWMNGEGNKDKWNYIDGVFFNAVVNLYYNTTDATKKEHYLELLDSYAGKYVSSDGTIDGLTSTLDAICESRILFDLYEFTGNEKYLLAVTKTYNQLNGITKVGGSEITIGGVSYANYSHQNGNGCTGEVWLDGMYMYAPFLTRYLNATNANLSAYNELLAQYSFIVEKMRDSATGLYYHAYRGTNADSNQWGTNATNPNCSTEFWGRSMGWLITSLVDVIEYMPADVPFPSELNSRVSGLPNVDKSSGRAFLIFMLRDALDSLWAVRDPNTSMYYQVLDGGIKVGTYKNYLETSCSSMFAYSFMKAGRLGLFGEDSADYRAKGAKTYEGIHAFALYNDALYNICKMADLTHSSTDYDETYYLSHNDTRMTSNDGKGSGPFTLGFIEYTAYENNTGINVPVTQDITKRKVHVTIGGDTHVVLVTKGANAAAVLTAVQAYAEENSLGTVSALKQNDGTTDYSATLNADTDKNAPLVAILSSPPTTANYTVETYKEKLDGSGYDKTTETIVGDIGASVTATPGAITGFTFDSENANNATSGTVNAEGTLVLSLYYSRNSYEISWVLGEGGATTGETPSVAKFEATVNLPANPTRSGFTFVDWTVTGATSHTSSNFVMGTSAITVTANWEVYVQKYTLTYMNEGVQYEQQSYAEGVTIVLPTAPQKANHTFDGWFTADGTDDNWGIQLGATMGNADLTVYAKFTALPTYTVTYVASGVTHTTQTVISGATTSAPDAPTAPTGKYFDAWYKEDTFTTLFNFATEEITSNVTLYAKFIDGYTVTFDTAGGTPITAQQLASGATISAVETEKAGFEFVGWFVDRTLETAFVASTPITANTRLFAKWNATASGALVWDASDTPDSGNARSFGDGTFVFGGALSNGGVPDGEMDGKTLTALQQSTPRTITINNLNASTSYTATVYFYYNSSSGRTVTIGGTTAISLNSSNEKKYYKATGTITTASNEITTSGSGIPWARVELVPVGGVSGDTYTVTYSANGKTGVEGMPVNAETTGTFNAGLAPTLLNFVFLGWNTQADGEGTTYLPGAEISGVASDITLYAMWELSDTTSHYVTFMSGTDVYESTVYAEGSQIALPTEPSKTGYTFGGWYTDSACTDGNEFESGTEMGNADLTVYAKWTPIAYSIAFNANDGTGEIATITGVAYGVSQALPSGGYTRDGYTLVGWKLNNAGATVPLGNAVRNVTAEDGATVTYYAVWTANTDTPYTVEIYLQNVSGNGYTKAEELTISEVGTTDTTVTTSAIPVAGFSYDGENENNVSSGNVDGDGSLVLAMYYNRNTYTVTFDVNGGSAVESVGVRYGATITAPTAPSKTGYAFDGWYDQALTSAFDFDEAITNNVTAYAKWTANVYTIAFSGGEGGSGSMESISATYGQGVTLTANAFTNSNATLIFAGWKVDGGDETVYANGATVTSLSAVNGATVTLVAQWAEPSSEITVAFDVNGGSGSVASDNGTKGAPYVIPASAVTTRTNYVFLGWTVAGDSNTYKVGDSVLIPASAEGDTFTLIAVWGASVTLRYDMSGIIDFNFQGVTNGSSYPNFNEGYNLVHTITSNVETGLMANPTSTTYLEVTSYQGASLAVQKSASTTENYIDRLNYTLEGWYAGETKVTEVPLDATGTYIVAPKWTINNAETIKAGNLTETTVGGQTTVMWSAYQFNTQTVTVGGTTYAAGQYFDVTPENLSRANIRWTDLYKDDAELNAVDNYYVYSLYNKDSGALSGASISLNGIPPLGSSTITTLDGCYPDATHRALTEPLPMVNKTHVAGTIVIPTGYVATVYVYGTTYGGAKNTYFALAKNGGGATNLTNSVTAAYSSATDYDKDSNSNKNDFIGYAPSQTYSGLLTDGTYTLSNASGSDKNAQISAIKIVYQKLHAVTFETNGGSTVETQYVSDGETATRPETDPTKADSSFGGWYTSADLATPFDFTAPITADVTVYAGWIEAVSYEVTLNANGTNVSNMPSGGSMATVPSGVPTRTDYAFKGWNTAANGTGADYVPGQILTADVTLYAKWTATYTISFDANNESATGEMASMTMEVGVARNLTENAFVYTGYVFVGWTDDDALPYARYADGASVNFEDVTPGEVITLYAIWVISASGGEQTLDIYYNGSWINPLETTNYVVEYTGLKNSTQGSASIDGGSSKSISYFPTGGGTGASKYIKFRFNPAVYSSFTAEIIFASNGSSERYVWIGTELNREVPANAPSDSGNNSFVTANLPASGSYSTGSGNDWTQYYVNFNDSIRIHKIAITATRVGAVAQTYTVSYANAADATVSFINEMESITNIAYGASATISSVVPTPDTDGYEFAYWQAGVATYKPGDVLLGINDNIQLVAKWNVIINSLNFGNESYRMSVSEAKFGIATYMQDVALATTQFASNANLGINISWDLLTAGLDVAENIVAGTYTIVGTVNAKAPSGYVYGDSASLSKSVTLVIYDDASIVVAGAGWENDGAVWSSGLALSDGIYTADAQYDGERLVSLVQIRNSSTFDIPSSDPNFGRVGFTNKVYSTTFANNVTNAGAHFKFVSNFYSARVTIMVTKTSSQFVTIVNANGEKVTSNVAVTEGASFNIVSLYLTSDGGGNAETYEDYYLLADNGAVYVEMMVCQVSFNSANEEVAGLEYGVTTNISQPLNYNAIVDTNTYLIGAKVPAKDIGNFVPAKYNFSGWTDENNVSYQPNKLITIGTPDSGEYTVNAQYQKQIPHKVTFNWSFPEGTTLINGNVLPDVFKSPSYLYVYNGYSINTAVDEADYEDDLSFNAFIALFDTYFLDSGEYAVKVTHGEIEMRYIFDGWFNQAGNQVTYNQIITGDLVLNASCYTNDEISIGVSDVTINTTVGLDVSELPLPTSVAVLNLSGTSASFENVSLGDWSAVSGVAYNPNVAGTYLFRAEITSQPSDTIWDETWLATNFAFGANGFVRSETVGSDLHVYIYAQVVTTSVLDMGTYVAEFTAFSYTGSGDAVVYNNYSNTHDKAWDSYYTTNTDDAKYPGTIIARNGLVKVIADNQTVVKNGNNTVTENGNPVTFALVDTDYHGQTYSMIKGYQDADSNDNGAFMRIVTPENASRVRIIVYAVKFRPTQNNPTIVIGPVNDTKQRSEYTISAHSYTETDYSTDFNYFYNFTPTMCEYVYEGNETVFEVVNTHNGVNVYVTGVRVEYDIEVEESNERIIEYNANNESGDKRYVTYLENENGFDAVVEKNFFYRDGYQFLGWSTSSSANAQVTYKAGDSIELDSHSLTLYGVWERATRITYRSNDSYNEEFNKYYTNGRGTIAENEFNMNLSDRQQRVFVGWNTESNGSGTTYQPGGIWNPQGTPNVEANKVGWIPGDQVLYAMWSGGSMYSARFSAYSYQMNAIDKVYDNNSQTYGKSWTAAYANKVIAKNGGIIVDAINATEDSADILKPMPKVASGGRISVQIPKNIISPTEPSTVMITLNAVTPSGSATVTIGGRASSVSRTISASAQSVSFVTTEINYSTELEYGSIEGDYETINIAVSGQSIYVVDLNVFVTGSATSHTLTYYSGDGLSTSTKVVDSTIVEINRFVRPGFTFLGWSTNSGATTPDPQYSYGKQITIDHDTVLYGIWEASTFNYKFWIDGAEVVTPAGGTFELGTAITKPETPTQSGKWFYGWYTDADYNNLWNFDNAVSFDMLSGGVVNFYGYFATAANKTEVEPTRLENSDYIYENTMLILDVVDNVFANEGSRSPGAKISATSLGLPAYVQVKDVDDNGAVYTKYVAVDWSIGLKNLVISTLPKGELIVKGVVRLSDHDFITYAFKDNDIPQPESGEWVNVILQQTEVSAKITLNNIEINFTGNSTKTPLVDDEFTYPAGTLDSDIINAFDVVGYYVDRNNTAQTYRPTNLAWSCSPAFGTSGDGEYTFTTVLVAPKGFEFVGGSTNDPTTSTYTAVARVAIAGEAQGVAGVGWEKTGNGKWIANTSAEEFVIDSNGDTSNRVVLSAVTSAVTDDGGYLGIFGGFAGLKVTVPNTVNTFYIIYKGGLSSDSISGNLAVTNYIGRYVSGNHIVLGDDLSGYVRGESEHTQIIEIDASTHGTTYYITSTSSAVHLSQILIVTDQSISTTQQNVARLRFYYNGNTAYQESVTTYTSDSQNAMQFVNSAKFRLPDFSEVTGLVAPDLDKYRFDGWASALVAGARTYPAGSLIDINFAAGGDATLYAIFTEKSNKLTFDAGYATYVVYVPNGKRVSEVINFLDKPTELLDLENNNVGYEFDYWKDSSNVAFNPDIVLLGDTELQGVFTAKSYTINYHLAPYGEEGGVVTDTVNYNAKFNTIAFTGTSPENLSFRAWTFIDGVGEDGPVFTDWNNDQYTLQNRDLVADQHQTSVDFYPDFGVKVTFHTEYEGIEGSAYPRVDDNTIYRVGTVYDLTGVITSLSGYEFVGWSTEENDVDHSNLVESITLQNNAQAVLYAIWQPNDITVTFADEDDAIIPGEWSMTYGENALASKQVEVGYNTELDTVTVNCAKYAVKNWYYYVMENDVQVKKYWVFGGDNPSKVLSGENLTLYAEWGLTVEFKQYSGSNELNVNPWYADRVYAVGETLIFTGAGNPSEDSPIYATPYIPGYVFNGWYTSLDFTGEGLTTYTIPNQGTSGSTVTLYASFAEASGEVIIRFANPRNEINDFVTMPSQVVVSTGAIYDLSQSEVTLADGADAFITFKGWTRVIGSDDLIEPETNEYTQFYTVIDVTLYAVWEVGLSGVKEPVIETAIKQPGQLPNKITGAYNNGSIDVFTAENAFNVNWNLSNVRDTETGRIVDLSNGFVKGNYVVTGIISLAEGYVWASGVTPISEIEIVVDVIGNYDDYYICFVDNIVDSTNRYSDYRLDKVTIYIAENVDTTKENCIVFMTSVTWNSQIDTTVLGVHFVKGSLNIGEFKIVPGREDLRNVTATVTVTNNNGTTDNMVYKVYQDSLLPDAPTAPEGFTFLCWSDGKVVRDANAQSGVASEFTAIFAKLEVSNSASLRFSKTYSGIRFSSTLTFFGNKHVASLLYSKANPTGLIAVSMSFEYGASDIVGGAEFKNLVYSIDEGGNAVVKFNGVISDIFTTDANGAVTDRSACDIVFTPTAIVYVNGLPNRKMTVESAGGASASQIATAALADASANFTEEQTDILRIYNNTHNS